MTFWVWVIIFIIIFLILWLISRWIGGQAVEAAPVRVQEAAPDDLALIEGIGPKVKEILKAAGISTFSELASAKVEALNELLDANDLQFLDPATWPEQAKLASEGRMDELQVLQDELKGGREVE